MMMINVFFFLFSLRREKNEIKKNAKRKKQYYDLLQKYDLKRDLGIEGSVPADSKIYRKIENKYNVSINVYIFQG